MLFIGGSGGYDSGGGYIDFAVDQNLAGNESLNIELDQIGFEAIHIPENVIAILYDPDGHRAEPQIYLSLGAMETLCRIFL